MEHKKADTTKTHLICDRCWEQTTPTGVAAPRKHEAPSDECCRCGSYTSSGIFVYWPKGYDYCEMEG